MNHRQFTTLSSIFKRALSSRANSTSLDQHYDTKKLLKIALIGAPNAGKSTLLNRLVSHDISSVSQKVHTTRANTLGVITEDDTQLEFYDTPGMLTRQHLAKHHLERSLLDDPKTASVNCDLISVVVDASNIREQKRINKGVLEVLSKNSDKRAILILNKVDLIQDKRKLIDIGIRLTQGCLDGQLTLKMSELRKMPSKMLKDLNLGNHLGLEKQEKIVEKLSRSKYVIELDESEDSSTMKELNPDHVSYRKFSTIFSISALNNDGVNELREYLISNAYPVETWPHGPDYLSKQSTQELAHEIIRGKVLDFVPHSIPYLVKFNYLECAYDEMGSLHINLKIICPDKYMIPKVIGERGVNMFRIIDESRDVIARTLNCDVKLIINVDLAKKKR